MKLLIGSILFGLFSVTLPAHASKWVSYPVDAFQSNDYLYVGKIYYSHEGTDVALKCLQRVESVCISANAVLFDRERHQVRETVVAFTTTQIRERVEDSRRSDSFNDQILPLDSFNLSNALLDTSFGVAVGLAIPAVVIDVVTYPVQKLVHVIDIRAQRRKSFRVFARIEGFLRGTLSPVVAQKPIDRVWGSFIVDRIAMGVEPLDCHETAGGCP